MNRPTAVIDWAQMLRDIQYLLGDDLPGSTVDRLPIGTRALATHLGLSRALVRSWLELGTRPHHAEGEHLIAQWTALTGKARLFVPMTQASLSAKRA